MTIKMDKDFTTVACMDDLRADMKQFKTSYTDNDLLNEFSRQYEEETGDSRIYGEVINAKVEAWKSRFDDTTLMVKLYVFSYSHFYIITYFTDMGLNIRMDNIDIESYEKELA